MKKSMDLFGEALLSYSKGDKSKFYFEDDSGKLFEHPIKRYFRKENEFSVSEKKIISLASGEILDVGCGTGLFIPALMKKGNVLGIDISSKVIQVAKNKGLNNCEVNDIFKFKTNQKFDTIVLIENNLGMGETVEKTKKLLKILSSLLKKDGIILTNAREVPNKDYYIWECYPVYKNKKGKKFAWVNFNSKYLKNMCKGLGLNLEVVKRGKYFYVAKISKIKS